MFSVCIFVAVLRLFVFVQGHSVCPAPASFGWGGTTSIAPLVQDLATKVTVPTYAQQGSLSAINCVNYCTCVLGFSDIPMNMNQRDIWGPETVSMPSAIQVYTFFTGQNFQGRKVKLDAKTSYKIFSAAAPKWGTFLTAAQLNNAFSRQLAITKVGRQNGAGSNQIIRTFWNLGAGLTAAQKFAINTNAFPSTYIPTANTYKTMQEACTKVASTLGAICYGAFGICRKANYPNIDEVWLKNAYGNYISSSNWRAPVPTSFPAALHTWYYLRTILLGGKNHKQTAPIITFTYALARDHENGAAGLLTLKRVLSAMWTANFQTAAAQRGFYAVPSTYLNQNIAAMNSLEA